jgi:two-component system response regulator BaeR
MPPHDGLQLEHEQLRALLNGGDLELTPVEFALLDALRSRPGRVFSRQQLMDAMYSDYRVVSDRAVDTHVKNLRRKLNAAAPGVELIESVYGLGYRFSG